MAQLNLGDLVYSLGFKNEQEFLRALDGLFKDSERKADQSGKRAGKEYSEGLGAEIKGFKDEFANLFSAGAIGGLVGGVVVGAFSEATQAAKQFARESVDQFKSYEAALAIVASNTDESLEQIEKRILSTAEASRVFSKTDVSVTLAELTKAGFSVSQAFELIEKSATLARAQLDPATGEFGDLLEISTQTGSVLRAFNFDFAETGRVADVVAKAAGESSASVTGIVNALTEVGPFASKAGLSIEQVASSIATLTNKGIPAAEAATGLRTVLSSMIDPPAAVKKQFDALGLTLIDSEGKTRSYNEVLKNLKNVADQGERGVQLLAQGMDTFAISIASSLGASGDEVNAFAGELDDAEGAAQDLADTVSDTTAVKLAELQARADDAKTALGERLVPLMISLYKDVFPPLISGLEKIIGLYEDWYFLLTGTTPEIERMQGQFASQYSVEGQRLLEQIETNSKSIEDNLKIRDAAQARLNDQGNLYNRFVKESDERVVAEQQAIIDTVTTENKRLYKLLSYYDTTPPQSEAERLGFTTDPFPTKDPPPPPLPPPGASGGRSTGASTKRPVDAVVDEAQRVANDIKRLQQELELGDITLEDFISRIEAHQRRLEGLQAAQGADITTTQRDSLLQARTSAQKALEQIEQDISNEAEVTLAPKVRVEVPKAGVELLPKVTILGDVYDRSTGTTSTIEPEIDLKPAVKVEIPEAGVEVLPKVTILGEVYDRKTGTTTTIEPELELRPAVKVEIPEAGVELLPKVTILGDVYDPKTGMTSVIEPEINVRPKVNILVGANPTVDIDVNVDALKETRESTEAIQKDFETIALSFPRAILSGIEDGDIGGALKDALGNASDFFLDKMLEAILGPIAQQLATVATQNLFAQGAGAAGGALALNPAGLALGLGLFGITALLSLLGRKQDTPEKDKERERSVSGAPEVNYNLTAEVTVNAGASFKDPEFYATWRTETENLVIGLLRKVRRED